MNDNLKKSDFFDKVYNVTLKIPYGRVTTYGAIANYLGSKKSARVVGWAMNASHVREGIPAHRVVNRVGLLTGKKHFFGINLMKQLLESEGINVKESQIIDFESLFWDPAKAL